LHSPAPQSPPRRQAPRLLAALALTALAAAAQAQAPQGVYIVGFKEAPLASYRGELRDLPAPPRKGEGRGRVDVASPAAKAYVQHVKQRQTARLADAGRQLGRELRPLSSMQHAFNGVVVRMTAAEAQALRAQDGIAIVEPYAEDPLNTDVGPTLIGAPAVWANGTGLPPGLVSGPGTPASPGAKARGEGVIFGIIDSGINFGSPSFSAVDADGYQHVNPLGEGTYLGTCAPGGIDEGRCNSKLIGGWDFVCTLTTVCVTPGLREFPGFADENGHGSHTASTAAGNKRSATLRGNTLEISGVAPRGNVIAYNACYTNAAGQGLCPNVSTLASINQAVADGVDVINYSIGGGTAPWSQAISLAFLAASDAGVYVAASAGNAGPGANTLGHIQPWVSTTAAAQHGRGAFALFLRVSGPGTVPPAVQAVALTPGVNGVDQAADLPAGTPLRVSPRIDTTDDACAALPAGQFAGAIAVVRRGTCSFTIKANNAAAAGAVAVVVANNAAGAISPSVPGTTVPVYGVTQVDGNALRDFVAANATATAGLSIKATPLTNVVDALAAFSSRGPGPTGGLPALPLVKPDITGPGVSILAAVSGPNPTGSESLVGLLSGTSMSSPHNAGAAGLLRQLHPSWTPSEIKSALMMTASQTVLLEDGVTPANPHAGGAGRLQVDLAAKAGLVVGETTANYLAADPATGGDPSKLNQPSMASLSCAGSCTFERTFRATRANQRNWDVRIEGLSGSVDRPSFNLGGSGVGTLKVTINTAGQAPGTWAYGKLVLTPRGQTDSPVLRMPIAVRVP